MILLQVIIKLLGRAEHFDRIGVGVDVVISEGKYRGPQIESRVCGDPYSPRIVKEAVHRIVVLLDVLPLFLFSQFTGDPFAALHFRHVPEDPGDTHSVHGVQHTLLDLILLLPILDVFEGGLRVIQVEDDVYDR